MGSSLAHAESLSGSITTPNGTPVCALVLASGKSTFSCNPVGQYSLTNLPTEPDGTIKLAVYADGFRPFAQRLTTFGEVPVVLTRQYDNGLSDLGPLDGVYTLLRTTVQANDGQLFDSFQPNIGASGTLTISGSRYDISITVSVNGQSTATTGGATIQSDSGSSLTFADDLGPVYDVALVERGRKLVIMSNLNIVGIAAIEANYWLRVSSPSASAFSASSFTEPAVPVMAGAAAGGALELLQ
ncbi:MAG: hypothetical protein HKN19_08110 [Halioglobus sp.]|nr:hypothetical protein [Halioglobus sp.]